MQPSVFSPSTRFLCALSALLGTSNAPIWAQDPTTPPPAETTTTENPAPAPTEITPTETTAPESAPAAAPTSRLSAEKISYEGSVIIGEGTPEKPVRFESAAGNVTAQKVRLDTEKQTVEAQGEVVLKRQIEVVREQLRPRSLPDAQTRETFTETARGQNLSFDFKNRTGKLDEARLELAQASLEASQILINGQRYTARDVIIRPGGLSPEEIKFYGRPPFNLRAREVTATGATSPGQNRLVVEGGALYFKSSRLFPIPAPAFRVGGRESAPSAPSIIPRVSFNSADRFFIASEITVPLNKTAPESLALATDLGFSQQVGFRGGVALQSAQSVGDVSLALRLSDVVSTQLTNRIELDRKPEIRFDSRPFLTFDLPGNRRGGFQLDAAYGDYTERRIGSNSRISSSRAFVRANFTTQLRPRDGVAKNGAFLRLFASYSDYGITDEAYTSAGYEVGYDGQFLPKLRGQISLRRTNINGETPFRFDKIEIAKELRATLDFSPTPRYIVPIDLRYDLSSKRLRDRSIGLLRSYKTFAYGVVYQSARNDLRLEVRRGF